MVVMVSRVPSKNGWPSPLPLLHAAGRRNPVGGGHGSENAGQLQSRREEFHQRAVKRTPKVHITRRRSSSGCGERLGERHAT
jgi:hypothetical protein